MARFPASSLPSRRDLWRRRRRRGEGAAGRPAGHLGRLFPLLVLSRRRSLLPRLVCLPVRPSIASLHLAPPLPLPCHPLPPATDPPPPPSLLFLHPDPPPSATESGRRGALPDPLASRAPPAPNGPRDRKSIRLVSPAAGVRRGPSAATLRGVHAACHKRTEGESAAVVGGGRGGDEKLVSLRRGRSWPPTGLRRPRHREDECL